MKKVIVYTFVLLVGIASASNAELTLTPSQSVIKENPPKTICIKNAQAADATKFFSSTTSLFFEVYKPGSKADFVAIIDKLKATEGVENCVPGNINGDYYAITLTLKATKDKTWFAKTFKDAGLEHIKINNNEAIEVGKL